MGAKNVSGAGNDDEIQIGNRVKFNKLGWFSKGRGPEKTLSPEGTGIVISTDKIAGNCMIKPDDDRGYIETRPTKSVRKIIAQADVVDITSRNAVQGAPSKKTASGTSR